MRTDDVIVAVASPPGRSMRGVVRLSGVCAFDALELLLVSPAHALRVRGASFVRLALEEGAVPTILLAMPGPASYTGEDTAELLLPGSPFLLEHAIDALMSRASEHGIDVRRAEPGEFTARAYFNGRLSLTEAEGVNATIAARSDAELRAAHLLTGGRLGSLASDIAERLARSLALVEAGIDFTDQEDVVAITPRELRNRLKALVSSLDDQLEHAVGFESLEAIPWVVLVGPPNAGKSTLYNALLGRTRAVVSPVAGTTRDVLTETMHIQIAGTHVEDRAGDAPDTKQQDAEVMLIDLAGLDRDDQSFLNERMQHAAWKAIDRAELLLWCEPHRSEHGGSTSSTNEALREHLAQRVSSPIINVRTKCDLAHTRAPVTPAPSADAIDTIHVSAEANIGLDELRRALAETLADRAISLAGDAMALQPRHRDALLATRTCLAEALALVEHGDDTRQLRNPELIAGCMRAALDALRTLAGDITPDDVLGLVFASFCVGK